VLIVSWNLAGRVKKLEAQASRLLSVGADILCLQETTPRTLPLWRERLLDTGYHVCSAEEPGEARGRPLLVLTASRAPSLRIPVPGVPWPERVLASRHEDGLEVVNVHSPISRKPDLVKLRTHLALHHHLAKKANGPRILCGDLNTPRREQSDGTIWTFARDKHGRLRPDRGKEWDQAELALLRGLEPFGFRDAFRDLHGYEHREISWEWARWKGGYRLDHLLVCGVEIQECRYEHAWRTEGLSDHSPLLARIIPIAS
jgi:exodeoxyribonuclease-3